MKDSGIKWIGEIPEDWEVERLQWLLEEIKEMNSPIKTNRVLSLTNKAGVIPYEEKGAQGNVAKEDYTQYKLAYPHTIVANSMNILIGSVGICDFFGCVSPVYYVFRPTAKADLHFINYVLQTTPFQRELRRYANGILEIRLRVSSNGILKRKIAVPCLSMQQKIVTELDKKCADIDKLIANQQGQIEKLKEYKQAIITQAVTKGLNPSAPMKDSGVEWIGNIASNFQVYKIGSLFACRNEKVSDTEYPPLSVSKGGIVPQIGTVAKSDAIDNRKKVLVSDFVINSRSDRKQSCGLSKLNGSVSLINIVLKILRWDILSSDYTHYLLKNYCFAEEFYRWGHGIVADLWTTSWEEMKNISIPVPSIFEQQQIADYLDKKCSEIDKLISIKQAKIEKLNEYKKSLIYEYVTGKKEVV